MMCTYLHNVVNPYKRSNPNRSGLVLDSYMTQATEEVKACAVDLGIELIRKQPPLCPPLQYFARGRAARGVCSLRLLRTTGLPSCLITCVCLSVLSAFAASGDCGHNGDRAF